MSLQHVNGDQVLFGTTTGAGFWYFVRDVLAYGPSWSAVPPLLLALGGVIGAIRAWRTERENWLDRDQERRHKEELHQVELGRLRAQLAAEPLPSRN